MTRYAYRPIMAPAAGLLEDDIRVAIEPGYLHLHRSGELTHRISEAWALMSRCELCPHRCGVDRFNGERGVCGMGDLARVSSWNLHAWEEPPISGVRGSGTVFFSGCSGRCRFCQNYPISHFGYGDEVRVERLAEMLLELQHKGAHNVNFVTPSQFLPHILAALPAAIEGGLRVPLVYNTGGYERVEALRLLEGIVDVWLPDAKYADSSVASRLSGFDRYVEHNQAALMEIHRQVGDDLVLGEGGLAVRGMIVRHLVLPQGLSGTPEVLLWVAKHLSPRVHVSLMDQYFPAHLALGDAVLGRKITAAEYETALEAFDSAGLMRGWRQSTTESEEGDVQAAR